MRVLPLLAALALLAAVPAAHAAPYWTGCGDQLRVHGVACAPARVVARRGLSKPIPEWRGTIHIRCVHIGEAGEWCSQRVFRVRHFLCLRSEQGRRVALRCSRGFDVLLQLVTRRQR